MTSRSEPNPATSQAGRQAPAGRFSVFADAAYRRLWGIGAINSIMRWIETVAVSVYVYDLTGSAWSLALVSFFRALPMLVFGIVLGAIADRVNRRAMLIFFMALIAVTYAVLGALVVTDRIQLWHIYVGTFIVGMSWATDFPVRRNMVTDVVGRQRIAAAIGIDQATMNIARIVGPTISGAFVQWIGVQAAYFTGAIMYGGAVLIAASLSYRQAPRATEIVSPLKNIAEGMRYVRASDLIVPVLIITVIVNVFAFPYTFVVPAIAKENLHIGPVMLGVLTSVEGIGATLGSVLIATRSLPSHYTRIYIFGACIFAAMVLAFSLADWLALAMPLVFLAGLGMSGFGSMQSIITLNATPPEMRGRVLGVLTVCIGSGPIGALQIGWLAEQFGAQTGVAIIGAAALVLMLLTMLLYPRFLRAREIEPEQAKSGPNLIPNR